MRLNCFLFAAATVLLASFDTVTATSDVDHVALSKVDSVHSATVINGNGNNDGNRFLRTSKAIEDDDDNDDDDSKEDDDSEEDTEDNSEDEERGLLNLIKDPSLKNIDNVIEELAKIPGAGKRLHAENVELFKTIASNKWTPESMAEYLGIATKIKTMSKDVL
ncbi:hypothetical protein G195_011539, partial [Phytophthora kernoviae 00238/432]